MLMYIMQFNLTICYICGSNTIPDSLSWLFQDSSPQEWQENESKYMHEVDDFILAVSACTHNRSSLQTDWPTNERMRSIGKATLHESGPQQASDDTNLANDGPIERGNRHTPRNGRNGSAQPATAATAVIVQCIPVAQASTSCQGHVFSWYTDTGHGPEWQKIISTDPPWWNCGSKYRKGWQ